MFPPRAHLRLFRLLESFPPDERVRWQAYVDERGGVTRMAARWIEERDALARLLGAPRRVPEAALVRRAGSRTLVCPLDLDLRAARATATLPDRFPEAVVPALVVDPDDVARARSVLARRRQPSVLDAANVPPPAWFLAFSPDDRRIVDPADGSGARIIHLTTVGHAAGNVDRAARALEAVDDEPLGLAEDLEDLEEWFDDIDESSLVELDYGTVAARFTRAELEVDRTCRELWYYLDALTEDDAIAAAACLRDLEERWAPAAFDARRN